MSGWLMYRLGYGKVAIVDPDNPNNPPQVTAAVTAPNYDSFTRIMQSQFNNNEEVRTERPASYYSGFEYVGLAPVGSTPVDNVWKIVRATWDDYKKIRFEYKENISWQDKQSAF